LLEQIPANLGHAGGSFEIGKISLRETEVTVEAVDQNLEGVLQGVKVALLAPVFRARMSPFASSRKCADR
jgi:hypothetical protein